MEWLIGLGIFVVLLTLLNLKRSRSDGDYLGDIHPYRKVMLHIMPMRNESYVFYDDYVVADELLRYLEVAKKRFQVDMQHLIVAAVGHAIRNTPTMNRFVAGRRLYQRKGIWVTFSMKREKLNRAAKLTAVKREFQESESLFDLVKALNESIKVERSDKVTYTDKEVGLFAKIPRPIMVMAVKLFKMLDYYNMLPASFIKNDGFYTSIFAANLGSLGMKAGYHHLYEWGTCPLFMMIGRMEERAFVENGQVVAKKVIPLRFTYDERIDDGLNAGHGIKGVVDALENPFELFGCVNADGSDDHPIGKPPAHKAKILEEKLKGQHLVVSNAS